MLNWKSPAVAAAMVLLAAGIVAAKDWWLQKPYGEWTKKDVARMLDNSPWGKIHTVTIMNPTFSGGQRTFSSIGTGDLEREKRNLFHIHFLTAKPVRMALARQIELHSKSPVDKRELQKFIDSTDDQHIILLMTVSAQPESSSSRTGYFTALMNQRIPELATNTSLSTNTGKRVFLTNYTPPGPDGFGARFWFPRTLPDGSLLITNDDKEIRFETMITLVQNANLTGIPTNPESASQLEGSRTDRIWMQFDLRKMMFGGKREI